MDENLIKKVIIEMFKKRELYIGVDTYHDFAYENWNNCFKINTDIKLYDNSDNPISEASDYVLIDKND